MRRIAEQSEAYQATITRKFQLTIPAAIARRLQLTRGDKVMVTPTEDGRIRVRPVRDIIEELAGSLAPTKRKGRRKGAAP
jgi:AbrB family looped-hinge helix DNA binding protein